MTRLKTEEPKQNEIILCKEAMRIERLHDYWAIDNQDIIGITETNPSFLKAYTPYSIGPLSPDFGGCVLTQLTPTPISRNLTDLFPLPWRRQCARPR